MLSRYLYSLMLTAALLFSNLGLAVNIHYCGNAIEKIELGYASSVNCIAEKQEKSCCKEKKTVDKKQCCKNQTIKQKTDEVVVKIFQAQHFADFVAPAVYKFQPVVLTEINLSKKTDVLFCFESNAPPLYKLYSQYLLYA